ncbi:hypothetical protein Q75_15955 [Bacillus coahuilensis p1.1.43]|uniref:Virulence-related protein n=1 Tax=Bacillus coahuilensis p1.1.43 TaxID=1150625 RepID=A0A147K4J1_9BACI|nr:hypothetical protein [Bacillus coahuilensis]KUP04285.1 hypothetical protein Q75_15955 [Bacillus coahuilensis p1.1.43]
MERKEMVKRLGEFLGVKPKFLNAPTFNYEIVTEEETYTIDRFGKITTSAGEEQTFEEIINPPEPEEELDKTNDQEPTAEGLNLDGMELTLPLEGHTGITLRNLVNMLFSKQHLIMKAFDLEGPLMDGTFAEDLSMKETSTFEEFKKALDELGTEQLPGLTFDFENERFTIKLATRSLDPEKIGAFQDLAALINKNAQKQKRASFKQVQDDNPKYAFRTWLIRLGMNGCEYKTTRKVLLANLEGSGAFRKVGEANG